MKFKDLYEEHKDTIRLDVFVDEGRYDLLEKLLTKYEGRLMDIVIDHERAKELYIQLRLNNKEKLANCFLRGLELQKSIVDYIERAYTTKVKNGKLNCAPSVRDLRELIGPL